MRRAPSARCEVTRAVGAPGQRVFYLQGREARRVVTLKVEKEQISALADYVAGGHHPLDCLKGRGPVLIAVPASGGDDPTT